MRYFWDDIGIPMLATALMLFFVFASLAGLAALASAYSCGKYEEITGKATRFDGMECFVQDGGQWYSWTEYKHRLATKGEFSK